MANVLITSDIHIWDFKQHNLFSDPLFRLHQFTKLAYRIVEIAEARECKYIILAGDICHGSSPRPYVAHAVREFLKILAKNCKVLVISGQHDQDQRSDNISSTSTMLSIYSDIENVEYLHDEGRSIDCRNFYFKGWTPSQDFSHVPDNLYDVLIGHASYPLSIMNQYGTVLDHGQSIDYVDKFKLCFFGDIHKHQVIGNSVLLGVPIQHTMNDDPDVGVTILDTKTLKWDRESTINKENKFLRFILTSSDHYDDDPYVITKKPYEKSQVATLEAVHKSIDIYEVLTNSMSEAGLSSIYDEVLNCVPTESRKEVNLRFKLNSIEVIGFRSIDSFTYKFLDGVTLIRGDNGSGKSSMMTAIAFALTDKGTTRDLKSDYCPMMKVTLSLDYNGQTHVLTRGLAEGGSILSYSIDGVDIERENKSALKSYIADRLEFLQLFDIMYHDQDRPRFLSSYSYGSRVELISKILGISVINELLSIGKVRLATSKSQVSANETLKFIEDKFIESCAAHDFSVLDLDIDELTGELDVKKSALRNYIKISATIKDLTDSITTSQSEIDGLVSLVDDEILRSTRDWTGDSDRLVEVIKTQKMMIATETDHLRRCRSDMQRVANDVSNASHYYTTQYAQLSELSVDNSCFTCGTLLSSDERLKLQATLEASTASLASVRDDGLIHSRRLAEDALTLESSLAKLTDRHEVLLEELAQVRSRAIEYNKSATILATISTKKETVAKLNPRLATSQSFRDNLEKSILDLDSLIDLSNAERALERIVTELGSLSAKSQMRDSLRVTKAKLESSKLESTRLECEIAPMRLVSDDLEKFCSLLAPTGVVTRSILEAVSETLSDSRIRVIAYKQLVSGEVRPDFNVLMNVKGDWKPYDKLSGGQKTTADLNIISKLSSIAGGLGVLIFDETLGQLDTGNLEYSVDLLRSMDTPNIFIVSHEDNFPYFDQTLLASLTDSGRTEFESY